jgi:hypothetical protein
LQLLQRLVLDIRPLLKALRPRLITECPTGNSVLNSARLLSTTGLNGLVSGSLVSVISTSSKIRSKVSRCLAIRSKALRGKTSILRPLKPLKLRVKATGLALINRILIPLPVKIWRVEALQIGQTFGVEALAKRLVHAANLLASRVEGATVNAG